MRGAGARASYTCPMRSLTAALALLVPAALAAQQPAWRAGLDARLAAADTTGALALLDSAARRNRRDLALAHATGMLAWAAVRPLKPTSAGIPLAKMKLLDLADLRLREAARGAPDSARYAIDLGRWFLYGDLATLRWQAEGWFEKGLKAARRSGDRAALADALDEVGMIAWRSHENMARRRALTAGTSVSLGLDASNANRARTPAERLMGDQRVLRELVEQQSQELRPTPGLDEAERAMERFREALAVVPWHPGAARHLAMALAEWERWEELRRHADAWTRGDPASLWAWAAAGLAAQRLGASADAERMLDSALARLAPAERARWTRLTRVGRIDDSLRLAAMDPARRAAWESAWWRLADPVTLTSANEVRAEFLARVAFAELRWTSEDFDRHGSDTDRGDIHVRFGPPSRQFTLAGSGTSTTHVWWYADPVRFGFVFDAQVAYGTARHGFGSEHLVEDARELAPASWRNVPVLATMDSVLVQPVRFRGTRDSTDLVVYARLPIERMLRGSDLATATVTTRFLASEGDGAVAADTVSSETVRVDRPDATSRRAFRTRLGDRSLAVRVEAWQPTLERAGRALATVAPLPASGFGTSDLLVADRVEPRDSARATRWTDLRVVPGMLQLRVGQPFGLAWETYGLAAAAGESRYEVTLELVLERIDRGLVADTAQDGTVRRSGDPLVNLMARAIGGLADAAGLTAEGEARVSLRYQRSRTAGPVALEWLTLELGDAPRGFYTLEVTVRDLATGARARTARRLRVVP